ncbi:MAG: hypothetical protein ACLTT2_04755 [Alphaproteobacteria bacterium]
MINFFIDAFQDIGAEKLHTISQPYSPYEYAYVGHSTKISGLV